MASTLIGQLLLDRNLISPTDLQNGLSLQKERRDKIGKILTDLGYLAEKDLMSVLSEQLEVPLIRADEFPDVPLKVEKLSVKFLRQFQVLPLGLEENLLTVAMADPSDSDTLESLRMFTGYDVRMCLGTTQEIAEGIERLYSPTEEESKQVEEQLTPGAANQSGATEDIEHLRDRASELPVIRLVNQMISRAVERRASDIHVEPFEKDFRIRYRIDGILQAVDAPSLELKAPVISRLKLMAKLNIAERRLPQDGRIKLKVLGKEIDLRVSILPTKNNERIVMRILNKDAGDKALTDLGFEENDLNKLVKAVTSPQGMVLVTGPTGSGKTTTLYSILKHINKPSMNILTAEDPVEYELEGIGQVHVREDIGYTFASALRSFLRQDPEVILVGEIRDKDTVDIALKAALTGHLVFSTIHTNDAPSTITRLQNMGTPNYLISAALSLIMAQRLARKTCSECKVIDENATPKLLNSIGFLPEQSARAKIYKGKGCDHCNKSGYKGRMGVYEILEVTKELKQGILSNLGQNELEALAKKGGFKTMHSMGHDLLLSGDLSFAEYERILSRG